MKYLLLSLAAATAVAGALPAPAALILEHLFAREYCQLRAAGYTKDSALSAAYQSAHVDGEAVRLRREDGTYIDADVVRTVRAIKHLCPQYLSK